jgi:hypothetical protein
MAGNPETAPLPTAATDGAGGRPSIALLVASCASHLRNDEKALCERLPRCSEHRQRSRFLPILCFR